MKTRRTFLTRLLSALWAAGAARHLPPTLAADAAKSAPETEDAYVHYVRTSRDFVRVKQNKAWLDKAFPGWVYMPWTYQWNLGYTEASGKWSRDHGYNGAFLDGNGGQPDSPKGKLDWIDRFGLRFYVDHIARKGGLHLWDGDKKAAHLSELHGNSVRPVPLNTALREKLQGFLRENIGQVKASPYRAAYALDDEASWGHFVHPTMWRVTDDANAFPSWLREVYGADAAPVRPQWLTYEDIRPQLPAWSVHDFDASPLLNQWSFNDSLWCNFIGDLVNYSNTLDPQTPCGLVGGQAPSPFGGYDYAKLTRKIQFIEAYNLGSSQAIIRSLAPTIPAVMSHFHQSAEDDIWQIWYYLAHGNRGHIGWVENWFDGEKPRLWHDVIAPHLKEAGQKIGPLLRGAEFIHDGVALYYSHPSVQLGWVFDAQAHGKTWVNRDGDHRLGASHLVRHAWENMLRDSGLQYKFVSYVDVLQSGIPTDIKTLILPACLCLSDAEARAIEVFCKNGGTIIADYLPGVWDQHGKGRPSGGALDALFGVRHDSAMKAADVFGAGDNLWCEVNQDANFNYKTYREFLTNGNTCVKDATGFNKAVRNLPTSTSRRVGSGSGGTAVLLNLSPQWFNAYRTEGSGAAKRRETFIKHIPQRRAIEIENANEAAFGYEITTFRTPSSRKIVFMCANPETMGTELGGGNAVGLKTGAMDITLKFAAPIHHVRDERRGVSLPDGDRFPLRWIRNEAIVISFDGNH